MIRTAAAAWLILLVGASSALYSSIAPHSPEKMTEDADVVLTGTVLAKYVRHEPNGEDIRGYYILEIRPDEVEKGEVESGQPVYARLYDTVRVGRRDISGCGPADYFDVPKAGDRVRAWLVTSPNGYQVFFPNGIEILSESPEPVPLVLVAEASGVTAAGAATPNYWMPVAGLLVGLVVGLSAGVALASRRRATRYEDEMA